MYEVNNVKIVNDVVIVATVHVPCLVSTFCQLIFRAVVVISDDIWMASTDRATTTVFTLFTLLQIDEMRPQITDANVPSAK